MQPSVLTLPHHRSFAIVGPDVRPPHPKVLLASVLHASVHRFMEQSQRDWQIILPSLLYMNERSRYLFEGGWKIHCTI